jgi:hypothetical protein
MAHVFLVLGNAYDKAQKWGDFAQIKTTSNKLG